MEIVERDNSSYLIILGDRLSMNFFLNEYSKFSMSRMYLSNYSIKIPPENQEWCIIVRMNMLQGFTQTMVILIKILQITSIRTYSYQVLQIILLIEQHMRPCESVKKYMSSRRNADRLANTNCEIPLCPPGMELMFGNFKEFFWSKSYGWYCSECYGNRFKPSYGNFSCLLCPDGYITSKDKTFCYDPYTNVLVTINSMSGYMLITLSGIVILLIAFIMMVFHRHRKTPIVLASDKTLSFLQLTVNGLAAMAVPVLFIGNPNNIICICRPLCIGIFLALSVSVSATKIQKFLLVFQARIAMNQREITLTKATEALLLILSIIISIVFSVICFQNKPPAVLTMLHEDSMKREMYCNTNWHVLIQILYITILLLCCSFQGFRARNLPANFKETQFLTFSSLLSAVSIIVCCVIYFSQTEEHLKTFIIACSVVIILLVNLLMLYGVKVFVILFKSHLNSTAVARDQIMTKMSKKALRATSTKLNE